ncbi:MAG TPA: LacI family DNA-binding transcriptional regulator [Actinomycetaceae bacterium]|nr:LacI family DNA-binding transcriptional regulator [Actinomycetaceae bacterium]
MTEKNRDRRTKSVTIYDVAKEAGVAASTVSRALSRPGRVSAETVTKVREAARKLGYRERSTVSRESRSTSRLVLVSVAGVGNLYYHQTLEGIHDVMSEAGYTVVVIDGRTRSEYERAALNNTIELAEAVIMISPRTPDAALAQLAKMRPTVIVNRILRDVHSVVQNVPDGMRQVIGLLEELGHKSVTYIAGPADSWIQTPRWETLSNLATERGITPHRIGPFDPTVRGGITAADAWMTNRTSSVVAYNDDMALGFMRSLLERGVRIPADVSVIGIDNSAIAPLFVPSLTSLALPGHGQGVVASRAVLDVIAGNQPRVPVSVVPMKLMRRGSTGPANTVRPQAT